MAKVLELETILPPGVGFPPKLGTWKFLQDAHREEVLAIMQGLIGDSYSSSVPYVLYGCKVSGGNITAGAVLFNGEIFLSPLQLAPTSSFPDVTIANILTTPYTTIADPVLCTDTVSRNLHAIRTVRYSSGASGSGDIGDFSSFIPYYPTFSTSGIVFGSSFGFTCADLGSPFYNVAYKISHNEVTLCGGIAVTMSLAGTFSAITFPAGLRPARKVSIYPANSLTNNVGFAITTAGVLTFSTSGADAGNILLDGITYRLS